MKLPRTLVDMVAWRKHNNSRILNDWVHLLVDYIVSTLEIQDQVPL